MNEKLVSVIVPTYGRSELLIRCIESIISQTYSQVEIVIVDDNGKNTVDQINTERKLSSYTNIKYIKLDENSGGGVARNIGVQNSSGEYITFLDDDDVYYPQKIERQLETINKNRADICLCHMEIINHGASFFGDEYSYANGSNLIDFLESGIAFTPMIFVRKDTFLKVGGFLNTPKFQDHTLMLRLLNDGCSVTIVNEKLFEHHSYNINRISNSSKSLKGYLIRFGLENKILNEKSIVSTRVKYNQFMDLRYFIRERKGIIYNLKYLSIAMNYTKDKENFKVMSFLYKDYLKYKLKRLLSK